MLRGILGLAALALAACGGTVASEDAGADAHVELDSGADSGALERDSGPGPRDAGTDAGCTLAGGGSGCPDSGPDLDGGPPGECWVIPQAGCAEGEACRAYFGTETRCEPAGHLDEGCNPGPGGACRPCRVDGRDLCQAGFYCVDEDRCLRFCHTDADCSPLDGVELFCRTADTNPLMLGYCGS